MDENLSSLKYIFLINGFLSSKIPEFGDGFYYLSLYNEEDFSDSSFSKSSRNSLEKQLLFLLHVKEENLEEIQDLINDYEIVNTKNNLILARIN